MAYQFSTGFDFLPSSLSSTNTQIFDTVAGTPTISSSNARFGGTHSQGMAGSGSQTTKNLSGSQATVIVGMAIRLTALPAGGNLGSIMQFLDSGTNQTSLVLSSAGVLQFYRNNQTTAIGTVGSTNYTVGVWHYLEASVTINNTTGDAKCWLDGVQIINSSSNLNTRQSANNSANQFRFGDTGNLSTILIDDMYIFDGTGGSLNAPLGDRRIITIMPNGAGSFTQFTPTGSATNFGAVNEIPANDNTSYVADATVNDRDSYTYESVTITGNADLVVPWARISKDDAGSHTVELSVTDTGNDAFSSAIAVPSSFGYVNGGAFTSSPNGAAAWSQTVINRTEFGIKIIT